MTTGRKRETLADCAWRTFECHKSGTPHWTCEEMTGKLLLMSICQQKNPFHDSIREVKETKQNCKVTKVPMHFQYKGSLIRTYRLFKTPARLSGWRSAPSQSRCTPQQNANGRQKALCWQDFDTGIVNSQGGRGRWGWMPKCCNPTCLSIN